MDTMLHVGFVWEVIWDMIYLVIWFGIFWKCKKWCNNGVMIGKSCIGIEKVVFEM